MISSLASEKVMALKPSLIDVTIGGGILLLGFFFSWSPLLMAGLFAACGLSILMFAGKAVDLVP